LILTLICVTQDGKIGSGNVSKEDIQREKREMLVKKGVQERGKLEVSFTIRVANKNIFDKKIYRVPVH
jgi:hypothetical protein